ncbi:hypothetical protein CAUPRSCDRAFT_11521 [Caulochytrium protostelioides]|uniref:Uncharacterized protein n=1 Tax=Caulochytrium protostelioides TaxID=1555241 RepID=A0A4P9WU67_9FUNG|nr:hypothetical protein CAUPRSCDRAFT_11521 [Caulochytrium protostelioides]
MSRIPLPTRRPSSSTSRPTVSLTTKPGRPPPQPSGSQLIPPSQAILAATESVPSASAMAVAPRAAPTMPASNLLAAVSSLTASSASSSLSSTTSPSPSPPPPRPHAPHTGPPGNARTDRTLVQGSGGGDAESSSSLSLSSVLFADGPSSTTSTTTSAIRSVSRGRLSSRKIRASFPRMNKDDDDSSDSSSSSSFSSSSSLSLSLSSSSLSSSSEGHAPLADVTRTYARRGVAEAAHGSARRPRLRPGRPTAMSNQRHDPMSSASSASLDDSRHEQDAVVDKARALVARWTAVDTAGPEAIETTLRNDACSGPMPQHEAFETCYSWSAILLDIQHVRDALSRPCV